MSFIVRNAKTFDGLFCDILITGDRIARIVPHKDEPAFASADTMADRIIDASGMLIVPSLVNAHAHSAMTLLRGVGGDMELMAWLTQAIWPLEAKMTDDDVYWGMRLAALEMIKTGTTVCNDMYLHPQALAAAARDSGMRFFISYALIDGLHDDIAVSQRRECETFFNALPDCGPLSHFALSAHSVYSTTKKSIEFLAAMSRERKLFLHVHLAETKAEYEACVARTGLSPAAYLDTLGALGPRTIAAHCLWLDARDFDLMAERGVTIAHNPVSNMKLSSGPAFNYQAAKERGIRVLLGTDGAASNNSLDLFSDMKIAGLLQKHHFSNPTRFPAAEIFDAASRAGHEFFGTGAGTITEGAVADFMLIDCGRIGMVPCIDSMSTIIYAASGSCVDTVFCAGRPLMRAGRMADEQEILLQAASRAARLLEK